MAVLCTSAPAPGTARALACGTGIAPGGRDPLGAAEVERDRYGAAGSQLCPDAPCAQTLLACAAAISAVRSASSRNPWLNALFAAAWTAATYPA